MSEKVKEILEYHSESHNIDFKMEQYSLGNDYKKHEFLKDISAMANHPDNADKYIIIGVKEKDGVPYTFHNISNLIDQANYQQYINTYIEPQIHFEYRPIEFKGYQLAYFRIFDNKDKPYLFKKEVQVVGDYDKNRIVDREGDGFIRVGTRTDKMVRSDFEKIYKDRYSKKDRKSDLIILPTLIGFEDFPSSDEITVKILDINIENTSNTSIGFDIEMKVLKSNYYKIIANTEFERIKNEQSSNYSFGGNVVLPNFHVDYEEEEEYFIYRRTKLRNMKTAVSIAQNVPEKEVFGKEIIVIFKEPCRVGIEVILRSDDFTSGALRQKFEVE